MKIFIAAPYTYNFDTISVNKLRELVKTIGHEPLVPHDFATDDPAKIKEEIAFDLSLVDDSDAIIADTTIPSHGVGMEIMYAKQKGKKVIIIHKNGNKDGRTEGTSVRISHMVVYHADEIIYYDDIEELEDKLKAILTK